MTTTRNKERMSIEYYCFTCPQSRRLVYRGALVLSREDEQVVAAVPDNPILSAAAFQQRGALRPALPARRKLPRQSPGRDLRIRRRGRGDGIRTRTRIHITWPRFPYRRSRPPASPLAAPSRTDSSVDCWIAAQTARQPPKRPRPTWKSIKKQARKKRSIVTPPTLFSPKEEERRKKGGRQPRYLPVDYSIRNAPGFQVDRLYSNHHPMAS